MIYWNPPSCNIAGTVCDVCNKRLLADIDGYYYTVHIDIWDKADRVRMCSKACKEILDICPF